MLKLKPKFLDENGEAKFVVLTMGDYTAIREALEDAEDARILEEAKRRHAGGPLIPFAQVKRQLASERAAKTRRKRTKAKP